MVRRYTPGTYKVDVSNIVALRQPTEEQKPKAKLPVSEKYKKLDEKLGGILPLGAPKNKFAIPTPRPSENNPVLTATRQPVKENAVLTATKKPVTNNKVLQSITELGQKKPKPKVEVVEPKAARKQVTTKPSPTGASLWAGDEYTKQTLNVDAKLREVGLPSGAELKELNYDPEFALNNPSFTKMVLKLPWAKPGAVLPGKAGQFETRTMERAGEIMAPGGKPTEATTGNKVLDVIADLVGTGLGFTTPGGAGGAVMGAGEKALQGLLANKVAPQILGKIPSKLVPLVERNAKVGLGGGLYGGLETAAQGGSPTEIAKGATEEAAMFMLADSVFAGLGKLAKAGYVHVRGALADKGVSKPMGEVRYEKTTPGQYESQGYEEFKPGSGIWVKRDANGAILDQQYVMVSVNGQVVPQYKLFQAGNRMGRILSTQEQEVIAKQFNANLEAKRVSVPEETKVVPEVKEQEVKKPFVIEEEIPVVEVKPVEEAKVEVKEEKPVVEEKPVTEQQVAQPKPTKQEPAIEQSTQVTPKVGVEQVTPTKAKEPWEMTKTEFVKANKQDLNKIANDIWGTWQKQKLMGQRKVLPNNINNFKQLYEQTKAGLLNDPAGAEIVKVGHKEYVLANYEHKNAIEKALKEGKPVSPQVLAEYPDLAPKQAVKEPKPAEVTEELKSVREEVSKLGEARLRKAKVVKDNETVDEFIERISNQESVWKFTKGIGSQKVQKTAIQLLSTKNLWGETGEGLRKALLKYAKSKSGRGWKNIKPTETTEKVAVKSEAKEKVKVVPTKEQIAVDEFANRMVRKLAKNAGENFDAEKNKLFYLELGNKLVKAINDNDFAYLRDSLHIGNPNSIKLYNEVTGLSVKTNREITESLSKMNGYKEWVTEKERVLVEKETQRKQTENEKKLEAVATKKIRYNDKVMTFDQYIEALLGEGFEMVEGKQGAIKTIELSKTNPSGSRIYTAFTKKEEKEFIRNKVGELSKPPQTSSIKQAKKELATEFDEEVYNFPSDIPAPQKTSLNQIASGLRMAISQKIFKDGMTVVDVGGGRFNKGMEYLANNGINGMVYDPYARTKEHNDSILNKLKLSDGADGIALNNVLNVIKENQERADVLEFAYRLLKPNGKMVVSVYEGNKSGTGKLREFSDGTFTWQENRLLGDYLKEIKQALPEARIAKKGSIFVITKLSQGEGTLETPQAIPNILGKLGWQQQPQKKIISRRDLVDYLRKELDLPIRVSRYSQKAKGIYKIKPEVVRTKLAHDLDVIVHEVGHHLDRIFKVSDGDSYRSELLGFLTPQQVAKLGKKAKLEGAAEFLRYYIANINLAKQKAPLYFDHFEKTVGQDILDIIDGFRRDWEIYRKQDARTDVLSAISVNEKVKAKLSWTKLYSAIVDELAPLEKAVKEMTKGLNISPEDNPFIRAWVARGWTGKAQVYVDEYGKLLEKVKNLDDLRAYMVSKRAIELHEKRGYDKDRFPFLIESAYKTAKMLESPELKKAFDGLKTLQDKVLQAYADAGMVTKEALAKMHLMNEEYIPFYRVFDENLSPVNFGKSGAGKKFVGLGQAVKTIKGSTRQIIDPLESILKDIYTLTSLAERNRVGTSFVELVSKLQGGGRWAEKIIPKMRPTSFQLEEISRILEQAGANVEELDMGQMATVFRPNMFLGMREGMENIVTVWRNGKPEFWQLDPEVYRSMLFLDSTSMNIVEKILSVPAGWLRVGATTTLEFMAKNPFRDVTMALVDGRLKLPDIFQGLASAFKRDDLYKQWLSSGASHAEMVSMDRDYLQHNLRKLLQEKTLLAKAKGVVVHPIDTLRSISMVTEQATRIGAFNRALKEGKGLDEAAVISRDITVDFGRSGFATKHINPAVAFFNANIQGMDKTIRMFKRDPAGCFARAVMFITVPSVLLYMVNKDDPNYQELPVWKKDLFWNIPIGGGKFFSLPKPFELGVAFATMPEKFMEYTYGIDKHAFDGFISEAAGNLVPIPMYTALMPWIETFANRSTYTGRPIVPQRESRLTPELQYGPYTTETAKELGKLLNYSPRKIDSLIRGYTGGLGSYATGAVDSIINLVNKNQPKTAKDITERMVIKSFIASPSAGGAASIERIYDLSGKAETLYASLKERKNENIPFPKLGQEEVKLIKALPTLRKITKNLSELRKLAREVQADPKLTPTQRKEKLDAIDMLQINYARKVLGKAEMQ